MVIARGRGRRRAARDVASGLLSQRIRPAICTGGGIGQALDAAEPAASPQRQLTSADRRRDIMAGEQANRTTRLRIEGMGCNGCVSSVCAALQAVPGVTRAEVDLARGTAEVEAPPAIEPERLIAAVDAAGYVAAVA
jgi:copper chaperone CopZ